MKTSNQLKALVRNLSKAKNVEALETVLAEKFETIITRGTTTSRMRDFYDIYILTTVCTYDSIV